MQPTAFPLTWPSTMPRTKAAVKSQFRTSLNGALKNVRDSLFAFSRDSGKKIDGLVISSNVTLGEQKPTDPGVAVWFTLIAERCEELAADAVAGKLEEGELLAALEETAERARKAILIPEAPERTGGN